MILVTILFASHALVFLILTMTRCPLKVEMKARMKVLSPASQKNQIDESDPKSFLRNWALKNNITHNATSELLTWLASNPDVTVLPKCTQSLLKTPSNLKVDRMGQGEFFYFGLNEKLFPFFQQDTKCNRVCLYFGVDLPLHKSTTLAFWPIMCKITNNINEVGIVFCVAIYCGTQKPPLEAFFNKFVEELS